MSPYCILRHIFPLAFVEDSPSFTWSVPLRVLSVKKADPILPLTHIEQYLSQLLWTAPVKRFVGTTTIELALDFRFWLHSKKHPLPLPMNASNLVIQLYRWTINDLSNPPSFVHPKLHFYKPELSHDTNYLLRVQPMLWPASAFVIVFVLPCLGGLSSL